MKHGAFKIFVKLPPGQVITLTVRPSETLGSLRVRIQQEHRIRIHRHHLMLGRILEDHRTLSDYNVDEWAMLRVSSRCLGGVQAASSSSASRGDVELAPLSGSPPASARGKWVCSSCTFANSEELQACEVCGTLRESADEWTCGACTLSNPLDAVACAACAAPQHIRDPIPAPCVSMAQSFAIVCTENELSRTVGEYALRAHHHGGCQWSIQRSYQDLTSLHDRLSAVFGATDLPFFPQAAPKTLFGRRGAVSSAELQVYFDALCCNADIVRTACFQATLGVVPPEPVSHLRVGCWLPALPDSLPGACARLDVRPESANHDSSAAVDVYHIAVRVVSVDSEGQETLRPVVEQRFPTLGADGVHVMRLPYGHQVEIEASAANSVGRSSPVSIRVMVPLTTASSSRTATPMASPPRSPSLEADLAELDKALHHDIDAFDNLVLETQQSCALPSLDSGLKVSDRQEDDVSALQDALARQREELERQRQQHADAVLAAAESARRAEEAEAQQLEGKARQEELERRLEQLSGQQADAHAPGEKTVDDRSDATRLLALTQELEREREEIRRQRSEHQQAEAKLWSEQQSMQNSRAQLAIVQAHTISMLERAMEANPDGPTVPTHELDPIDGEAEAAGGMKETSSSADVWSMDWASPEIATDAATARDLADVADEEVVLPVEPAGDGRGH